MDRSTKSFSFVNLKHPDDLKDEETQLRIRRLAMTEVGKLRRKSKMKRSRNEIILELKDVALEQPGIERFGGSQVDPFGQYPFPLDDSMRAIITHIFAPNSNHPSELRGSWYPVCLTSAAAFHNLLANSQNFIFQKINGFFPSSDEGPAVMHHHKALQELARMMKDPKEYRSDEALGAISAFMCHMASLGKPAEDAWHKHRNALLKILNHRGGVEKIRSEDLRITLSWADLMGAYFQDISPLLALPYKWTEETISFPESPQACSSTSLIWREDLPTRLEWISIFEKVSHIVSLNRALSDDQLKLAITTGCWLEPILWRLLAMRPLQQSIERENLIEEVCRLGLLLFLAPFWRTLGQTLVRTGAVSRNLLSVLMKHMVEWRKLKPLLIWTLYFGAVETGDLAERSQLVFMLAVLVSGMGMTTWHQVMELIKSILWAENIFADTEILISEEVMAIISHQNAQRSSLENEQLASLEFLEDIDSNS